MAKKELLIPDPMGDTIGRATYSLVNEVKNGLLLLFTGLTAFGLAMYTVIGVDPLEQIQAPKWCGVLLILFLCVVSGVSLFNAWAFLASKINEELVAGDNEAKG